MGTGNIESILRLVFALILRKRLVSLNDKAGLTAACRVMAKRLRDVCHFPENEKAGGRNMCP